MKRFRFSSLLLALSVLFSVCAIHPSALTTQDKKIVAFGDSITASGAWFSDAEKAFGVSVVNKAVGGWNSADGHTAFASALAQKPDVLLLSFGMNDAALDMAKHVPLETYLANMRDMIERATAAGARVVLVIENPIGETDYYTRHDRTVFEPYGGANAFYLQYVLAARELAAEYDLVTADLYRIFTETAEATGVAVDGLLADGVHPNARGYALYASALVDALYRLDLGDANGDGIVNSVDYLLVKRAVLGTFSLGERAAYADVNRDGAIDSVDYLFIKRAVLGTFALSRNPA